MPMSASPLSIIMAGVKAKITPQILELAFLNKNDAYPKN